MKISEFFQDYEKSYSQKRLQVFLAFIIAVILVFMNYGAEYIAMFLTYGSLNTLVCTNENKYLSRTLHK